MQKMLLISPSTRLTIPMKPVTNAAIFSLAALVYAVCFVAPAYAGGLAGATRANPNTRVPTQQGTALGGAGEYDDHDTQKAPKENKQEGLTCGEPVQAGNQGKSDPGDASTRNRSMYGPCPPEDAKVPHFQFVYFDPQSKTAKGRTLEDWDPIVWAPLQNKQTGGAGAGGSGGGGNEDKRLWQDAAYVRGGDYSFPAAWSSVPMGDDAVNGGDNIAYKTGGTVPRVNSAHDMVDFGREPQTTKEKAFANYIRATQASQQYILSAAATPTQRDGVRILANQYEQTKPGLPATLGAHSQTLRMVKDAKEEYPAGFFLSAAAKKTLIDPKKGWDDSERPQGTAMRTDGNLFAQARDFLVSDAYAQAAGPKYPYQPFWPEIKLKNTDKYQDLPAKLEKVRINDLMAPCEQNGDGMGCEGFWDVTDPFSPRGYVPELTASQSQSARLDWRNLWGLIPNAYAAATQELQPANERDEYSPTGKIYSQFPEDNVVCASNPTKNNTCKSPNAVGEDKVVKVDLIGSRTNKNMFPDRFQLFDREIKKRLNLNVKCWRDQLGTICWKKPFCVVRVPCWVCFFGSQKKTGTVKEGFKSPPCSTDHYNFDRPILPVFCPNYGNPNVVSPRHLKCKKWPTAPSLCAKLRAPLQMVNSAKIRMFEPTDKKKNRYPDGVGEADDFSSKYGCRMPYMVQRDTGKTVHAKAKTGQDAWDYNGATAAIAGAGVVAVPDSGGGSASFSPKPVVQYSFWDMLIGSANAQGAGGAAKIFNVKNSLSTLAGGLGIGNQSNQKASYSNMGMTFKNKFQTNPMPSSFGSKLMDQAWAIRNLGMNALPLYHKLPASGTASSKVSFAAGGQYERETCSECDEKGNCTECGSGGGGGGGGTGGGGGQKREVWNNRVHSFPLSYRGEPCTKGMFDEDKKKPLAERRCFPFVGAKKEPPMQTGLDQARPGCIALLFNGGGKIEDSDTKGKMFVPTLGYIRMIHTVKNTQNSKTAKPCTEDKNCHVIIEAANDGFFPTGLGLTNHWGFNGRRTMYKQGNIPESVSEKLKEIGKANKREEPTDTCKEPQFGQCVYESWDNVPVYCPDEDVREGK
jgi:hypothetical protein